MSIASPQSDPHFPFPLPQARPPLKHGQPMTVEEWLNLPEDGPECWVSNGILHLASGEEDGTTWCNPRHAACISEIVYWLNRWLREQTSPRGRVLTGDAAFQLTKEFGAGIDIAYVDAQLAGSIDWNSRLIRGVPRLTVEVLSPSDSAGDVATKIENYLSAGVAHVWVVEPRMQTVTVYRPGGVPQFFTVDAEITAEPDLPGFRAPVREFFP